MSEGLCNGSWRQSDTAWRMARWQQKQRLGTPQSAQLLLHSSHSRHQETSTTTETDLIRLDATAGVKLKGNKSNPSLYMTRWHRWWDKWLFEWDSLKWWVMHREHVPPSELLFVIIDKIWGEQSGLQYFLSVFFPCFLKPQIAKLCLTSCLQPDFSLQRTHKTKQTHVGAIRGTQPPRTRDKVFNVRHSDEVLIIICVRS